MNHVDCPHISVMMPCYNNGPFIEQAMRSVLQQQLAVDLELVIVDDASTDDSVEIIHSLRDDRVRLLRNASNRGIAAVRNQLLAAARGRFLSSLDGDDYYFSPGKLACEWNRLAAAPEPSRAVAYSDVQLVDAAGQGMVRASRMAPPQEGILFQALLDRRIMIPRDFLVPAELARSVGGFDEKLRIYEDWDYKLRLAQRATFLYTGHVGIAYRRHRGGLSAAGGKHHRQQLALIRRKYCAHAFDGDPMNLLVLAGRVARQMARVRAA
jgi:glycosyltransferase involved in cell wall biosynthesis